MLALVKYTVFLPDNYQGGSGEYIKLKNTFELEQGTQVQDLKDYFLEHIESVVSNITMGWDDSRFFITSIQLLL